MGMEKKRKRKMKKQVLAAVLSVLLALSTGACGSREAEKKHRHGKSGFWGRRLRDRTGRGNRDGRGGRTGDYNHGDI